MYVSTIQYRKEPVSVVAYAVEPHNGGLVPPLGPHHIGPSVLSPDTARACKQPSTRSTHQSVGRSILLKTESPWKKHSKTSDVQYVPEELMVVTYVRTHGDRSIDQVTWSAGGVCERERERARANSCPDAN